MEILNETVYDSSDLEKVIRFVASRADELAAEAHERFVAAEKERGFSSIGTRTPTKSKMPASIRFGYTLKNEGYTTRTGGSYRSKGTPRIGIVPPARLPIPAMMVIAIAAAGIDPTVPKEVMDRLCTQIAEVLGHFGLHHHDDPFKECPGLRYNDRIDRESARKSKEQGTADRLRLAEQEVASCAHMVAHYKQNMEKAQLRLEKAQAKLDRLKSKGSKHE